MSGHFTPEQIRVLDLAAGCGLAFKSAPYLFTPGVRGEASIASEILAFADRLLTPAQRHADRLAYFAGVFCKAADRESYLLPHSEFVELRAILDEIAPPAPPTVEELTAALEPFARDRMTAEEYGAAVEAARSLYRRVRPLK